MKKESLNSWIAQHYSLLLGLLLVFSFLIRIWQVEIPDTYYFDEVYHAMTAKLIARNDPRAYEWWHGDTVEPNTAIDWLHPPFAKLFQATGILLFGENSFGWRISSVIFGVMAIWMTASVAQTIFKSQQIALLSAFLFSLDGLALAQSRIAMNDIHVTFFLLFATKMYLLFREQTVFSTKWKQYLILSGIGLGLALVTKWTGILVLGIFLMDQVWNYLKKPKFNPRALVLLFFAWIFLPMIVYLLGYGQMFLQGKDLNHFLELENQVKWYQFNLDATHPYQSTPIQWILNLRPVWLYVDYSRPGEIANKYAQGNSALYLAGLGAVFFFLVRSLVHRRAFTVIEKLDVHVLKIELQKLPTELIFLIPSYLILWVPYLLSPRIMFFYHYLLAVPFLCMILAYAIYHLLKQGGIRQSLAYTLILLIVINFIVFFPNWMGIFVPATFRDSVYGFIPSWK